MEADQWYALMRKLIPRLNYKFSIKDLIYALYGVIGISPNISSINEIFATERVYCVNHARTGLKLLLNSLSLSEKAKIGVQAFNCRTVFNAIHLAGFDLVFIDVDSNLRISIDDLEKKKDSIDALIITHTFGIPAELERVKKIMGDKPIIEDCAHAFLARYNDQLLGKFGDAAVYSIGKGKFPSIGPGGFVLINNKKMIPEFEKQYDRLRKPGKIEEIVNVLKSVILSILHKPFMYGYFTNTVIRNLIQKKDLRGIFNNDEKKMLKSNLYLFCKKGPCFELYLKKQLTNLSELLKSFSHRSSTEVYADPRLAVNGFMLPILHENAKWIAEEAKSQGIEFGRHFSESINWAKQYGYSMGNCPNAENIVDRIIVLPCHYAYPECGIAAIKKLYAIIN